LRGGELKKEIKSFFFHDDTVPIEICVVSLISVLCADSDVLFGGRFAPRRRLIRAQSC